VEQQRGIAWGTCAADTSSANYRARRLPMIVCASHDPFPDYLDRVRDVLDAAC
jgi:hypothetical protein